MAKLGGMDQQPPSERPSAEAQRDASRPKHDRSQKRLFSHRRMAADLLRLLPAEFQSTVDPRMAEILDEWAEENFRQGRMEGRAEGMERERALLLRLTRRRFGADVSEALSGLIKGVEDPDRLTEVGDWILDCATGRELLNRAGGG